MFEGGSSLKRLNKYKAICTFEIILDRIEICYQQNKKNEEKLRNVFKYPNIFREGLQFLLF
jgi:hypothetical protein